MRHRPWCHYTVTKQPKTFPDKLISTNSYFLSLSFISTLPNLAGGIIFWWPLPLLENVGRSWPRSTGRRGPTWASAGRNLPSLLKHQEFNKFTFTLQFIGKKHKHKLIFKCKFFIYLNIMIILNTCCTKVNF